MPATRRVRSSIATSLQKAAELSEWKKLWKPRGSQTGAVRRGLGIGVNAWGGDGHACTARTTINPDGSVLLEMGTQDLGTGTRTIMTQVAAETLGLPMGQVKLVIGDNSLPPGGSSGGSTTVGGVSSATRKSGVNALAKLFEAAAPALNVQPEELEAVDGTIRVKSDTKQEHDLGRGLQEDRSRRQDQRDRRQRAAQSDGPQSAAARPACRWPTSASIPKPAWSR